MGFTYEEMDEIAPEWAADKGINYDRNAPRLHGVGNRHYPRATVRNSHHKRRPNERVQ